MSLGPVGIDAYMKALRRHIPSHHWERLVLGVWSDRWMQAKVAYTQGYKSYSLALITKFCFSELSDALYRSRSVSSK